MNRILKHMSVAMLAALALAFNACTDDYEYTPEPDADYSGAYMTADQTTLVLSEDDEQQLTFTIHRHDTTEAAVYRLYTDTEGFDIPSEVSFAAGEKSQTITVDFDLPSGTVNQQVVIGIEEDDAYEYGAHSLTFTISRLKKVTGAQYFESGLLFYAATWDANVYESGFTENSDGTTVATYIVMEPFHDPDVEKAVGFDESETTGYQYSFSISSDGTVELTSYNGLFYISASLTGDADITGDALPSSTEGRYYSSPTTIASGLLTLDNFVMFSWSIMIGNTGYGFTATSLQGVIFPDGYDPITQTQE